MSADAAAKAATKGRSAGKSTSITEMLSGIYSFSITEGSCSEVP